jgi:hypothetical protein
MSTGWYAGLNRELCCDQSHFQQTASDSVPRVHCVYQIHHLAERRELLTTIASRRCNTQRRDAHILIGSDSFAHHLGAAQQIRLDDQL